MGVAGANTANGTYVQLYDCNGTANGAPLRLWTRAGTANQKWTAP